MDAVVFVYYRAPYGDGCDFVGVCDGFDVAHKHIKILMQEFPDRYQNEARFEFKVHPLVKKENV